MASSNAVTISYAPQSPAGTPEADVNYQPIRVTSESLRRVTTFTRSNLIRSDRMRDANIRTSFNVAGSLNSELVATEQEDFFQWLLQDAWSAVTSDDPVADLVVATSTQMTSATTAFDAGISAGDWIHVTGHPIAANNIPVRVSAATTGQIDIDRGTLTTDTAQSCTLRLGGVVNVESTRNIFTIEKDFSEVADAVRFHGLRDCEIDSVSLGVNAENIITAEFGVIGIDLSTSASQFGTGKDAVFTTKPMSAVDNAAAFFGGTQSLTSKTFTINITNSLGPRNVIGTEGPHSIRNGSCEVSGSFQGLFETGNTELTNYLANTVTDAQFALTDADGHGYVFDFPELRYGDGGVVVTGLNEDADISLDWAGEPDTTTAELVTITRL